MRYIRSQSPLIITLLFLLQGQCGFAQKEVKGSLAAEVVQKQELGYLLSVPQKTKEKKPLIVFLHGSGEKGTDTEKLKIHGPLKYIQNHKLDAYILAPQCPENDYWNAEALYQLILKIQKENDIDPNRIYLTGLSMGGWGAWNLAIAHPDMFAALVPICGFVDRVPMIENCKLAAIPTHIFHGLLDDVVSVDYATAIYKKIKACPNAKIELTIFDDANHDAWTRVYDHPEIYQWMLGQTKTQH
ncbi:prolyl oligopeptidase family serine peptidase [Flavobacterium sp.]|uniref:carboxylesterase family protein n=1 Tax=Flavobacterium sp. TaxID=239 RepID=UPI0039E3258C